MTLLTVRNDDVRRLVSIRALIDALRNDLAVPGANRFRTPQRHSFGDGAGLVMSGFDPHSGSTVSKCLSIAAERDPAISGVVVWTSPQSTTTVVAEAEALTAMRTGAIVGLATDVLAPRRASTMHLFGAGAQAYDQVQAVLAVRAIRRLTVSDHSLDKANALGRRIGNDWPELDIETVRDPRPVLPDADVVCCATTARNPLFDVSDLRPEVHVNAIGSFLPTMQELPADLLGDAALVAVDGVEAVLAEAGEIIRAVERGVITLEKLRPLGELLSLPARPAGRTVFKTVGVALQDWSAARVVAQAAGATA